MENFRTIEGNICGQILEKKSKFIANLFYVESIKEAEEKVNEIKKKYNDARHNCYAYIVMEDDMIIERCSDDGEPQGTAGGPILNILKNNDLCNILVIVTRYFGGILLGTGGLVRSYSDVTLKALENSKYIIKEKGQVINITVDYSSVEPFKYYCRKNGITILNEEYLESIEFLIEISNKKLEKFKIDIDNIGVKTLKKEIKGKKYVKRNTVI